MEAETEKKTTNKIHIEMKAFNRIKLVELNGTKISINDIHIDKHKGAPVEVTLTFYADVTWISQAEALRPEPE